MENYLNKDLNQNLVLKNRVDKIQRVQKLVHHIIKETLSCLYCSESSQQDWSSEWNKDHHYKTFLCKSCGRKNFVRACFDGSGHDSFGDLERKLA